MLATVAQLVVLPMLGMLVFELLKLVVPIMGLKTKTNFRATSGKGQHTCKMVMQYLEKKAWYVGETQFELGEWEPQGFLFGRWFVACITTTTSLSANGAPTKSRDIKLWCTSGMLAEITGSLTSVTEDSGKKTSDVKTTPSVVRVLVNDFTWRGCNAYSAENRLVPKRIDPTMMSKQDKIAEEIVSNYQERMKLNDWPEGNSVVLLSGKPGVGKSTIAILVAQMLNGILCACFRPTESGTSLQEILNYRDSSHAGKTLVLLVDEFDTIVRNVHAEKLKASTKHITEVTDKASLNGFMDRIATVQNLIVILTTNWTVDQFNVLDPSYVRDGRTTLRVAME